MEKELRIMERLADILDASDLSISSKVGVLEVLKHSLIQATILSNKQ
jgi:hypothetical protein